MNISRRQLEAFLAVARLSGFTRAAERLHLTQSAVSLLVRELESQLSVRLFDRTTRAVQLTDAGRELYPFAEKALAELQAGSTTPVTSWRRNAGGWFSRRLRSSLRTCSRR